ncbi:hypothetical protein [Amycolatopsis sp. NPDC049159]
MTTATALLADHHPAAGHGRVLGLEGAAMGLIAAAGSRGRWATPGSSPP